MKIGSKIMLFVLLINVSAGLLDYALPNLSSYSGVSYDSKNQASNDFYEGFEDSITGAPITGDFWPASFLDFFSFGVYSRVKNFLRSTIFGLTGIMLNLGIIIESTAVILDIVQIVIYTSTIFYIFTGRSLEAT